MWQIKVFQFAHRSSGDVLWEAPGFPCYIEPLRVPVLEGLDHTPECNLSRDGCQSVLVYTGEGTFGTSPRTISLRSNKGGL